MKRKEVKAEDVLYILPATERKTKEKSFEVSRKKIEHRILFYGIKDAVPSLESIDYELDTVDLKWVKIVRKQKKIKISLEDLRRALDQFEKLFYLHTEQINRLLQKRNRKEDPCLESCNICLDTQTTNENAIVYCENCSVKVHQSCYGVSIIPEGPWLCMVCSAGLPEQPACIFCPNTGGPMKPTREGSWAHAICAWWIPEMRQALFLYHEELESRTKINSKRLELVCILCFRREGAPIQCTEKNCHRAFHPTCAQICKMFLSLEKNKAFCPIHTPEALFCTLELPKRTIEYFLDTPFFRKALLFTKKKEPTLPRKNKPELKYALTQKMHQVFLERVSEYTSCSFSTLCLISRYWSLKRKAKNGSLIPNIGPPFWPVTNQIKSGALLNIMNRLVALKKIFLLVIHREKKKRERVLLIKKGMDYWLKNKINRCFPSKQ